MKYSSTAKKLPILAALAGLASVLSTLSAGAYVHASSVVNGVNAARGDDQPAMLFGDAGVFSTISNVLLFIVGAIAVIMIVIGGLRYVISGGDSTQVQAAKNTILYALVGVIVAILAYAAVNFVVASFIPSGVSSPGSSAPATGASTR
jgi:hypothetical protein